MRIILTIAGISPQDGGPSRSVPALAVSLAELKIQVHLVTCASAENQNPPLLPQHPSITTQVLPRRVRSLGLQSHFREFLGALEVADGPPSLIHDNGLWLPTNHYAARAARELRVPFVVSPRGMLEEWALSAGKWKKKVAWLLFQKHDLQSAALLHATSADEARTFRTLGLTQPIAAIPNGVDVPTEKRKAESRNLKSETRTALFLSRIHTKKGLLDLVKAWRQVKPVGWRMVIAGPDENNHQREVESLAAQLGVRAQFDFIGPVQDSAKWDLYQSADLFVLPSYSENFGIVIAEALVSGVPVITTKATPWSELESHRCGWWIETGAAPLASALKEATALSADQRFEMGARGRKLVEQNYTWFSVDKKIIQTYSWLLGQGPKPDCVS